MRKPDPPPGEKGRTSSAAEGAPRRSLDAPISSSSSSTDSGPTPAPPSIVGVKRKKSRVYAPPEDDESDGTQADAETGGARVGSASGWANVDGRRRSVYAGARRQESDDVQAQGRRHSIAV